MPWGKLDDSLYDHPKLDELAPAMRMQCVGLWAVAISWSNRRLTDGHIPANRVKLLGGTTQQADALVAVGLFDQNGNDYRVHDFLDFNDSREYVMSRRAKDADRQRHLRESRQESQRDTGRTNGVIPPVSPSPAGARVPGPSRPSPSLPGPDTHSAPEGLSQEEGDVFSAMAKAGAYVRPESKMGQRVVGIIARQGGENVKATIARLVERAGQNLSDRQIVFGIEEELEAIPSKADSREADLAEQRQKHAERVQAEMHARRVERFRYTGEWDDAFGPRPAA